MQRATVLLLLGLVGCSHQTELEPAANATELDGNIAWTGVQGVQILAKGDDWEGDQDLLKITTPVYVVINNRGSRPIRLHYSKMSLVTASGENHVVFEPSSSPNREAQTWALHEVVIQPGSTASGYVYFQQVPASEKGVTLGMELIDARSGDRFAVAKIPFVTD